eukprot:1156669-Pelagomonas_calceolata.AAC.2
MACCKYAAWQQAWQAECAPAHTHTRTHTHDSWEIWLLGSKKSIARGIAQHTHLPVAHAGVMKSASSKDVGIGNIRPAQGEQPREGFHSCMGKGYALTHARICQEQEYRPFKLALKAP